MEEVSLKMHDSMKSGKKAIKRTGKFWTSRPTMYCVCIITTLKTLLYFFSIACDVLGLPWWPNNKEAACNMGVAEDTGSIPGSGRAPGGGHGIPLQYSCMENLMDREAWWATCVPSVAELDTTEGT